MKTMREMAEGLIRDAAMDIGKAHGHLQTVAQAGEMTEWETVYIGHIVRDIKTALVNINELRKQIRARAKQEGREEGGGP